MISPFSQRKIFPIRTSSTPIPLQCCQPIRMCTQAAISESANETLALRTASEIQKLEKTAIDQLPDGKELMKRIQESNATPVKRKMWDY